MNVGKAGLSRAGRAWASAAGRLLRASRTGLFVMALFVGAGSGFGAVGFRYLIYAFTWLATGRTEFGQQGRVASIHLPWLGLAFIAVIPIVGGLIYGPLIYRYAREARGHGVPEVMIAVAENGGRIRPQVSVVKAIASALCIGTGGSVGREGPIVQIGSALASGLGQWVRMPENRLRILVACGAAGGIAATFNAPITGVFFGIELILRAFSVEAIFTVMLSATVADVISQAILGSGPFLAGFPRAVTIAGIRNYLLVSLLAVLAALAGLGFKAILYRVEDLCDRLWRGRPEWARPAVGGVILGALLLALPQLYGVGYPVMYRAVAGRYVLWFLIVLAVGKMVAASLTIGIGGSGGVFAPALFIGTTSGMAFGEVARHVFGPVAGPPALYAAVAMAAVFTAAARAPLTSLASVVEMTGDFALSLPVMLAVAIATAVSRALSHGTIYTTKLLRRGIDIDRRTPAHSFDTLTVADAMHSLPALAVTAGPGTAVTDRPPRETALDGPPAVARIDGNGNGPAHPHPAIPGTITHQREPQALFAGESLAQALRQLMVYGRDGLPVVSPDGQTIEGWITNLGVLRAVARQIDASRAPAAQGQLAADWALPDPRSSLREPPTPLAGYKIVEVTIDGGSPAAGRALGTLTWPLGWIVVSVLHGRRLRAPDPKIVVSPGDRVNLLVHRDGAAGVPPPAGDAPPAGNGR